jgi:hypothetical protein
MTKGGADPKNSEKNVRCKPVKKETPEWLPRDWTVVFQVRSCWLMAWNMARPYYKFSLSTNLQPLHSAMESTGKELLSESLGS